MNIIRFFKLKVHNRKGISRYSFTAVFFIFLVVFYLSNNVIFNKKQWFNDNKNEIINISSSIDAISLKDSLINEKEKKLLLKEIESKVNTFLTLSKDINDVNSLNVYFKHVPELLNYIPSMVPLKKGDYNLSSSFGYRYHPVDKKYKRHFGLDLAAEIGKPIYASANGVVTKLKRDLNGYGYHIIIKHRYGFETLYGHMNTILVQKNQIVTQGDLIGTVGQTGKTTGPHLHYEIKKNDNKIDPFGFFNLKKEILTPLLSLSNN
ncbi:murein DD-endopeptidase MepM/ murein hydrolase activator NlpD [Mesoflavibacter sabulilitoris]|uniref:M23ase beta-sheet core domain-containing protein n=1 Tax=Mesoflavibacter zeaxanthinifaciens subsp. sabulilitoris TaxID=1520893 RepID=A0A2T1NNM5_9FLAO|nr:M23 family metallopeptidase [Mesoflavibacter zeaxanthinifaciens]MBB3125257.1 murein DD-endopeptidase MepM/ murein hydrolase activator NlpD [Mesoflavibacter zeaxanthinifaciens subsp. sabulilitoris]PSG94492.1 hypothetical protein C7H61_00735 [Mesoflavibacter zeaxanthinifaciens subsp. sabulilitoris]